MGENALINISEEYYSQTETLENNSDIIEIQKKIRNKTEELLLNDLFNLLEEHWISKEKISFEDWLLTTDVNSKYNDYEKLPHWYWIKWWAARLLLEMNLWLVNQWKPRDIDLIRYIEEEPELGMDKLLAKKFMPRDFKYWDGVELLEDNYFSSRDLSINEVLLKGNKLFFSKQCLEDTLNKTIRVTDFEYSDYWDLNYKMIIKSLRFWADYKHRFWKADFDSRLEEQFYDWYNNLFRVALNLDKSNWVSREQCCILINKLKELWKIPYSIRTPEEAREYIEKTGDLYDFDFDNIPKQTLIKFVDDFIDYFDYYEENYVIGNKELMALNDMHYREIK